MSSRRSTPVGRFKAAFFAGLGFTSSNWSALEWELRKLAQQGSAEPGPRTAFGQKYLVRGKIMGPVGRGAGVLAVWIVLDGEEAPRLVTVYPEM
jgi:hypothetical protein